MSNDPELTRKLAALSQPSFVEDGAIQLGRLAGPDALAALLEVIDNTMLPRQLVISAGDASATFAVGGRRLRSLVAVSDNLSDTQGLVGKQLTRDDVSELKAIAGMLEELANCGPLGVTRVEMAQGGGQTDTGVGLKRLSEIWDAHPYADPLPGAEKFLAALGEAVLARKVLHPEEDGTADGDKALLKALQAAWDADLKGLSEDHATLYPAAVGARCVTTEGRSGGDALFSYVELDGQSFLLATSADSWGALSTAWPLR